MNKLSKYLISAALVTTPIIAFGLNNQNNNEIIQTGVNTTVGEAVRIQDGSFTASVDEALPWRMELGFSYTDSTSVGIDTSQEVSVTYSVLEDGEVAFEETASSVPETDEATLIVTNVENENPFVVVPVLPSQEIVFDTIEYTNSLGEADSNDIALETTSAVQTILADSYYVELNESVYSTDVYLDFDVKYDQLLDSSIEAAGYDLVYPIDFDKSIRLETDHGIITPNAENEEGLILSLDEDSFKNPAAPIGMTIIGLEEGENLAFNSFTYTDEIGTVHRDSLEGLSTESLTVDWNQKLLDSLSMGAINATTLGLSFEYTGQVENVVVRLQSIEDGSYYSNEVLDGDTITNKVEINEVGNNTTNIIEINGLEEGVHYKLMSLDFEGSTLTSADIQDLDIIAAPSEDANWKPGDKDEEENGMLWLIILAIVILIILVITIPVTIYLVKR